MSHPVVHFEIGGGDGQRLRAFYEGLFGWETRDTGSGYWLVPAQDSGIGGGLMQTREDMPAYVTVYVAVDDLRATLDRGAELGGKAVIEPTPIPGVGAFALFQDPAGNVVGILAQQAQQ